MKPLFLRGGTLRGGRLTSHDWRVGGLAVSIYSEFLDCCWTSLEKVVHVSFKQTHVSNIIMASNKSPWCWGNRLFFVSEKFHVPRPSQCIRFVLSIYVLDLLKMYPKGAKTIQKDPRNLTNHGETTFLRGSWKKSWQSKGNCKALI